MISCQKDRKYKKENVELQHVVQGMSIIEFHEPSILMLLSDTM